MVRLRGNPDFAAFLEVVQEYERDLTERMVGATETPTVYRSQGGITACRQLREMYVLAPTTVERIKVK